MDRRADGGLKGSNGHNQIGRVNFRVGLRASASDEIQLRAGSLAIDSGQGFPGNADDPLRERFVGSSYAQLDWRRSLGEDEDLAFSISRSEESYRDTFFYSLKPFINGGIDIDFSGRASNDAVSLQHTFRSGSALRVVWGGDLRREQVVSRPLYNTDATFVTEFARLFGNAEWRVARDLVLNAGAMFEKSSVSGDSFAPRLMLNWHVTDGQTLRAGVSRAFRPPSTFEKFSDVRYSWNSLPLKVTSLARGKVQPERMLARELGYLGEFPRFALHLDVRAFHERIDGFVRRQHYALPPGTTFFKSNPADYVNSEDFSIQGVEYQIKWRPWRDAQLIFNQAYTDISSIDSATALAAPKLASSITFFQKLPGGLDLSLMHQDSGTVTLQGSSSFDQVAMTRTDLRLSAPLRFGPNRGEVALVVQNLGAPYQDFSPKFQFERRAFITLRMEN